MDKPRKQVKRLLETVDRVMAQDGRSIVEICKKAGISHCAYYHWRSAKFGPNLYALILLLNELNLELKIRESPPEEQEPRAYEDWDQLVRGNGK